MGIIIESAGLHVVTVPKCACSSVKHFLHEVLTGAPFKPGMIEGKDGIHQVYKQAPFAETEAAQRDGLLKVAIVRDPVDRILSCYFNKVRGKAKVLARSPKRRFRRNGVKRNPSALEFVTDLPTYRKVSFQIRQHSHKLAYFLGTDPGWFDRLYDISEVGALFDLVNERAGTKVAPVSRNNSPTTAEVEDLDAVVARIEEDFAEDLEVFGGWIKKRKWVGASAAA